MIGRFSAESLSKFPHLSPADSEVARAWFSSDFPKPTRLDYDVRLGVGIPSPSGTERFLAVDWRSLTQLRVDAVGYSSDSIWIIEFKPRANLSAIGQLLAYSQLYATDFSPSLPLRRVLVTFDLPADLQSVFSSHGIEVFVIPRATS